MTMRSRIAQALKLRLENNGRPFEVKYGDLADAVLDEMREPTEAMKMVGGQAWVASETDSDEELARCAGLTFAAMIAAATDG